MPATREKIAEVLESPHWTLGEKMVVKWQFGLLGDFYAALFNAIKRADEDNLTKLAQGFPAEVGGFIQWSAGDLGHRLRAAGLEI